MPQYLARVAAAATRTTTAAVPPVAAPPVLPAGAPLVPAALPGDSGRFWAEPDEMGEQAGEALVSIPPTPLVAPSEPRPPQAIRSGKRRSEAAGDMPGRESSDAAAPGMPGKIQTWVEALLPKPGMPTPIIRAPAALRPAGAVNQPMPRRAPAASPAQALLPVEPRRSQEDLVVSNQPAAPPIAPARVGQGQRERGPAASVRDGGTPVPAAALPVATAPAKMGATPQSQAQPRLPDPPADASRRQARITIGQIDVQVHNRPPPAPMRPRTPASSPATDRLEQRFLNRFRLKL